MSDTAPSPTGPIPAAHAPVRVSSVKGHVAALGMTAVLLAMAFPLPGWGWVAHFALVPAGVLALRSASTKRLGVTAYIVSFLWWLWMIRWLYPVTGGGYVALCAYMAVYFPAALLCIRGLAGHRLTLLTLAVPAVWTSLDLVRGWFLAGGFGWLALAHTQAPFTPDSSPPLIAQTADLFGEHTVGFVVGATNGLILDLLQRPWVVPHPSGRRYSRALMVALLAWCVVVPGAMLYGALRNVVITPSIIPASHRPDLRVAVVQTNVPQDNKIHPTPEQQQKDWSRLLELTTLAARNQTDPGVHLIIWPETVVPAPVNPAARDYFAAARDYYRDEPDQAARYQRYLAYHDEIAALTRELRSAILVGASAYRFTDPARRYNATYLYYPNGRQAGGRYDKIHRVPFGEYIPWVESWPWLKNLFIKYLSPYESDYTLQPGTAYTVFQLPISTPTEPTDDDAPTGHRDSPALDAPPAIARLGPSICFEDTVARVTRRMAYDDQGNKRIDLLVNLTNDGWYQGHNQRLQHLQIAVLRSIENRVPTARAVNTGVSGFIDSTGRIGPIATTKGHAQFVDGTAVHDVWFDPRSTLFSRVGHGPMIALAATTAIWVYFAAARPWLRRKFRR